MKKIDSYFVTKCRNALTGIGTFYRLFDECTFTLNNEPNRQNDRYWYDENPRINLATRTQYPQKINIWAGIFNDSIIGPFEITDNVNAEYT